MPPAVEAGNSKKFSFLTSISDYSVDGGPHDHTSRNTGLMVSFLTIVSKIEISTFVPREYLSLMCVISKVQVSCTLGYGSLALKYNC